MKRSTESVSTNHSSIKPLTHWRLYAAAGAAAIAASTATDAAIITGNLNIDLKLPGTPTPNHTTVVNKTFMLGGSKQSASLNRRFSKRTGSGGTHVTSGNTVFKLANAFHTASSNNPAALRFNKGDAISGSTHGRAMVFSRGHAKVLSHVIGRRSYTSHHTYGAFALKQLGYAGFQLNDGRYGWLQVEVLSQADNGFADEMKLLAYAYEDVPNAPIAAGQTVETSTPEPSAFGLLAMGSVGVLAWRRRRKPLVDVS